MAFIISVDRDTCIGCRHCTMICPKMFVMVGDKSKPVKNRVNSVGCARQAAAECPVNAIMVKEV